MIFSFFKRRKAGQDIEPLYGAMMTNALKPQLYLAGGVPDTFEGRFESVTLHAALVMRRLRQLPPPAGEMAQELVDRIFDGLDSAMRETGISDVAVPKRIKAFAQGFYGRLEIYTAALDKADQPMLAEALARNVCEGAGAAPALVEYVTKLAAGLDALAYQDFARGVLPAVELQEMTP